MSVRWTTWRTRYFCSLSLSPPRLVLALMRTLHVNGTPESVSSPESSKRSPMSTFTKFPFTCARCTHFERTYRHTHTHMRAKSLFSFSLSPPPANYRKTDLCVIRMEERHMRTQCFFIIRLTNDTTSSAYMYEAVAPTANAAARERIDGLIAALCMYASTEFQSRTHSEWRKRKKAQARVCA